MELTNELTGNRCYIKYLACLATGLFSFYNLLQLSIFNVISHQLLLDFQLTTTQLGILSSCFLWANAVGLVPVGLLLDRYSVRKVALSFLCLTSFACLVIAHSHSLLVIAGMRIVQGLASAASLLTSMRLAIRWFDKKPHLAVGFIVVLALCGGIAGTYGFSYMLDFLVWRQVLILVAVLGWLLTIILFYFLYDNPQYHSILIPLNLNQMSRDLKSALLQWQNLLGGVLIGLMNSPIFVLATLWGNWYLTNLYQLSSLSAAGLSSCIFAGVMLGSLGWGYLADRYLTSLKVLRLGCGLALLFSFLLFISSSYPLLIIAFLLIGLGFASSAQNIIYTVISYTNPSSRISTATSIATLLENGIGALLQIVFGFLLYHYNSRWSGLILFCMIFSLSYCLSYAFNKLKPIND